MLTAEECLAAIRFPVWAERRVGTAFTEMSIRQSDFALVAAACQLVLDDDGVCRKLALGIGGAEASPVRATAAEARLTGTQLEAGDIDAAMDELQQTLEPLADVHASADYRRRVAGALAARVIGEARDECYAGARVMSQHAITLTVNGRVYKRQCAGAADPGRFPARASAPHRHPYRLRARRVRRVLDPLRRTADALMPDLRGAGGWGDHHDRRRPGARSRRPQRAARQLLGDACVAMRLLYARHADRGACAADAKIARRRKRRSAMPSAAISAAAPATSRSSMRSSSPRRG